MQTIPYELQKGKKLNLEYFKVQGFLAKAEVLLAKRVKIGPKTVDSVFIGYAMNSKTYKFLVQKFDNLEINVNTVIE